MTRNRVIGIAFGVLFAASLAGCRAGVAPRVSFGPPTATVAPSAAATATPVPSVARSSPPQTLPPTGTLAPGPAETLTEDISTATFSDPTTIDNPWFPLIPGTRLTHEGSGIHEGRRLPHRVVLVVTDLTKIIAGVRTRVVYELDFTEGDLVEAEIALFAQADDGTVWHFGQYPEVYEDEKLIETPAWIAGLRDAKAGITIKARPRLGGPSYSQGWGPEVGWADRARVFEVGSRTCTRMACYDEVLITDEFARDEPDAHQFKYYVQGLGVVRVGWSGMLEQEQEVLELVKVEHLTDAEMAKVRAEVLAQEDRGYKLSPDVYGKTPRAEVDSAG